MGEEGTVRFGSWRAAGGLGAAVPPLSGHPKPSTSASGSPSPQLICLPSTCRRSGYASGTRRRATSRSMFRQNVRTLPIRTCSSKLILACFLIVETVPLRRKARLDIRSGVRLIAKRAAIDIAGQSIQFARLRRLVGDRRTCCCRACRRAGCSCLVNLTTDRLN